MITTHSLTKRYGAATAVGGLTFEVPPGVVTGFLGPNGSGMSTTVRMIMGIDIPASGRPVKLITPGVDAFTPALIAAGAKVGAANSGWLPVAELTALEIGDLAACDGLRVHELAPIAASLEDAFMKLTRDEVEYRPSTLAGATAGEKE